MSLPRIPLLVSFLMLPPAATACRAQPGDASVSRASSDLHVRVDAYLQPYLDSRNFSGAILVARRDEVLVEAGYGLARLDPRTAIEAETKFQIGSISKSFTAALVLLLRDREQLRLDDPVNRYIEDFPHGDAISIHDLLVHTSGLTRYVFLPDYRERSQKPHTASDLVDWIAEQPLAFTPGARSAYSNANYTLLARVLEIVSGSTFEKFLTSELLEPRSLDATGHRAVGDQGLDSMALGYSPVGVDGLEPAAAFDYTSTTGSGSLYSTVRDLYRWHRALTEARVLGADSTRLMFEPHVDGRGYGWTIASRLDRPVVAMSGWDGVGFSSELVHFPDDDLTVIVLCNLNVSTLPTEVATNVAALALGEEAKRLELRPGGNREAARAAAGVYQFGPDFYVPNATMSLAEADGQLTATDGDGAPAGVLLALNDGRFLHRQHWLEVELIREHDVVTAMRYGSFVAAKTR